MRRGEQGVFKTFATAGLSAFKGLGIIRRNAGFNPSGVGLSI